jgi:tryptophanyl-tRNA synthetase
MKDHYRRGGLGDVKCKKLLIAVLEEMLEPIRARRKEWEQKIEEVYAILEEGTQKARATAASTLNDVREAMKINYFQDKELISEQAKRFREASN